MISYHNKKFRSVSNPKNGEISSETIFHYQQNGNVVYAEYAGGKIVLGHLIALVDLNGCLDMHYHQINDKGELMTGKCFSTPEVLLDGRIRLYEKWGWTSGDKSEGELIIEEI